MAFQLSPGINVSEVDLTTVIPAVATSTGAFAGNFAWGPVNQVVSISNENQLVDIFGEPNASIAAGWFSAANFLAYSNNLKVVRAANTSTNSGGGTITATSTAVASGNAFMIQNVTDYEQNWSFGTTYYGAFAARCPGALGNGIQIVVCPNSPTFEANLGSSLAATTLSSAQTNFIINNSSANNLSVGDSISITANGATSPWVTVTTKGALDSGGAGSTTINTSSGFGNTYASLASAFLNRRWKYYNQFTSAPTTSEYAAALGGANDEMHIVVVDTTGQFTGTANTVVEKFGFVSKASDAKKPDGSTNYYKDVIKNQSKYFWLLAHPVPLSANTGNTALGLNFLEPSTANVAISSTLVSGNNGVVGDAAVTTAFGKFANAETLDISLIVSGNVSTNVQTSLISLAESRKDCILFLSPQITDVVNTTGNEVTNIINNRNLLSSSSYTVMDSGWKYQYDKYNDVYRWVPLNGDIAGLTARTDNERDPWFSPAGTQRGVIKNVVKLSWNPTKSERDSLYTKGVNPVVSFPGEGTILYGDKTLLSRPSAFDRINVRRLFITLEKAVSRAARASMFEFNDQFTRAQFVNLVSPFLRDVQGRRGIYDFKVVCDESNNTAEVIDRNEFIGDIYIKPTRSVNFIQLNFVAVRTGVNFDEITGKF